MTPPGPAAALPVERRAQLRALARARVVLLLTGLVLLAPALAPALGAVTADVRPVPAGVESQASPDDGIEGDYVAQSLWSAKMRVQQHRVSLFLRPFWSHDPTGAGVRIGIVDTGVDATHPDLEGAVVGWRDFTGDARGVKRGAPYDDHGHGTHVAAIAAGRGHFQPHPLHAYWLTGLKGVAPGADLLVAKAMDHAGRGSDADVAAAVHWLVDPNGDGDLSDGADVINLSIGVERGGSTTSASFIGSETRRAVNLALLRGVTVVVSSGNEGADRVMEPGNVAEVITVGAVDRDGRVAAFSNTGGNLDVVAPGVLLSAYPRDLDALDFARDGYAGMAGTSMAAPVITGLVALVFEANPALLSKGTDKDHTDTPRAVEALVKAHAEPLPGTPARAQGAGVVNAYATLAAVDAADAPVSWPAVARAAGAALLVAWIVLKVASRVIERKARRETVEFELAQ